MAPPTAVDHSRRLHDLTALYEQGKHSECIEECEQSLREHVGMAPYWRIKTYCLLVGANENWEEAEKWRRAGEWDYGTLPRSDREALDELPFMRNLRDSLDELYAYQAEGAPSWFQAMEKLDRWVLEEALRPSPTSTIGEDEDEDEGSGVEGQATAQSDSIDDEATNKVATVPEPAKVDKMQDGETQLGTKAIGGAKKRSTGSTTKDMMAKMVSKFVKKIQFAAVEMAPRFKKRASVLELFPSNLQDKNDSEHQQRMAEAVQSEMEALDAEDAFQEAQLAAREAQRKKLRKKLR